MLVPWLGLGPVHLLADRSMVSKFLCYGYGNGSQIRRSRLPATLSAFQLFLMSCSTKAEPAHIRSKNVLRFQVLDYVRESSVCS